MTSLCLESLSLLFLWESFSSASSVASKSADVIFLRQESIGAQFGGESNGSTLRRYWSNWAVRIMFSRVSFCRVDSVMPCWSRKRSVPGQEDIIWRIVSMGKLQSRQAGSATHSNFLGYVPQLSTNPSLQREYKVWRGRGKVSLLRKFDFLLWQSRYLCPWRSERSSVVLWKRCNSRCRMRVHVVADSIGRANWFDLEMEADASLTALSTCVCCLEVLCDQEPIEGTIVSWVVAFAEAWLGILG